MKRTKRLLAWLLTLAIMAGLFPGMGGMLFEVQAADAADEGSANVDAFGIEDVYKRQL